MVRNVFIRAAVHAEGKPQAWWHSLHAVRARVWDEDAFDDLFQPACFARGEEGDSERVMALCFAAAMRMAGDI